MFGLKVNEVPVWAKINRYFISDGYGKFIVLNNIKNMLYYIWVNSIVKWRDFNEANYSNTMLQ